MAKKSFSPAQVVSKLVLIARNDALDRFGTPLAHRFPKEQILEMLLHVGLVEISFSDHPPYWHCSAVKAGPVTPVGPNGPVDGS